MSLLAAYCIKEPIFNNFQAISPLAAQHYINALQAVYIFKLAPEIPYDFALHKLDPTVRALIQGPLKTLNVTDPDSLSVLKTIFAKHPDLLVWAPHHQRNFAEFCAIREQALQKKGKVNLFSHVFLQEGIRLAFNQNKFDQPSTVAKYTRINRQALEQLAQVLYDGDKIAKAAELGAKLYKDERCQNTLLLFLEINTLS